MELDRAEAIELAQALFKPTLESASFPYDELEVEKFLSNRVARIARGDQPVLPGAESTATAGDALLQASDQKTLLESALPLRAKDPSGEERPVDLALEPSEGSLAPGNPLVEVAIPTELGEGIDLPESGVSIEFPGTPEGIAPSTLDESAAFYPNVAEDTDLIITPIPAGVETLTQIRSPEAPRSETFHLSLPAGAKLKSDGAGGAEAVLASGDRLLEVPAPVAVDATGNQVASKLEISDDSLRVTISPEESTVWPALVDPLIQAFSPSISDMGWSFPPATSDYSYPEEGWQKEGISEWMLQGGEGGRGIGVESRYTAVYPPGGGVELRSNLLSTGAHGAWRFRTPEWLDSQRTTYISRAVLQNLTWGPNAGTYASPYLYAGLHSPAGWVSLLTQRAGAGYGLPAHTYEFTNPAGDPNVKEVNIGLYAQESVPAGAGLAKVGVEGAVVEMTEPAGVHPEIGLTPTPEKWINQTAVPLEFTMSDTGLGMYSAWVAYQGSPPSVWRTLYGCTGITLDPCPRTWYSQYPAHLVVYNPAVMPTGIDSLEVVGEDALGKTSAPATVHVKVDHTSPTLTLSGTLTEQAKLGTKRPSYTIAWNATDGTASAPQSGIAKTVVKVDGEVVDEADPGCATQNCSISREATLESSDFSDGSHTLEVIATDEVGLSTTKTTNFALDPMPKLTLSGTLRNEAEVGTTRSSYDLKANAEGEPGVNTGSLAEVASFGSSGSSTGQFSHPAGIAIDGSGDLWVADSGNDRIEEFDASGKFLESVGSKGSGNGQFSEPKSVAIASDGDFWVADSGDNRLEEFGTDWEFIKAVGSGGGGNGQFDGPEDIAIDPEGDIWVADTGNDRVQELNGEGEFIKVVSGLGQIEPTALAVGPGGSVWIVDWTNSHVVEVSKAGTLMRSFGSEGSGNGQFVSCDAIAVDTNGDVWVVDEGNDRVQEFDQSGEYVGQFGSAGSGSGQFNFSYPIGIAADPNGDIWVSDPKNDRIEEWSSDLTRLPIIVEIKVDGETVESAKATCNEESCSVSTEWTLDSSHYAAGQHRVTVEATDPAGNVGTRSWIVELNHDTTRPSLSLSGTLTEQSTVGTGRPHYALYWTATDGTAKAPQSGIARTVLTVDGMVVDEDAPGCATQNCSIAREWKLEPEDYSDGRHTLEVTATDEVGLTTTKTLAFELSSSPTAKLSGTATEQARLGVDRPRYGLHVEATGGIGGAPIEFASFKTVNPDQVAIDPKGDIWIVDRGPAIIVEYGPEGKFLSYFEGSASGESRLDGPQGIAIDSKGDIWVADTGNDRVEEFGPKGEFLSKFGEEGSENGQLSEPTSLAIDPDGDIWVADTGNDRVEEFGPGGRYMAQFYLWGYPVRALALDGEGGFWAGYTEGCLMDWGTKQQAEPEQYACGLGSAPTSIVVDSGKHIWAEDSTGDDVAEYEGEGEEALAEFGEPGSDEGQLKEPEGIAIDPKGDIWVADTGNARIEKWSSEYTPSSISTNVQMDGETVKTAEAPCSGEACSISSDWTLDASDFPAGKHTVTVTTKESPGRATTKTLDIELQSDTTGPKIDIGGELGNAPAGWVEQESYGFHAVAKDGGSGVASMVFKIDGETVFSADPQECAEGGCEETLSTQVDMSSYVGGAHEAEVVATDLAGNSSTRRWTINVDPEGHISTSEAEDTLEALDETSESTALASNEELLAPEQIEGGDNPTFKQEGNEITSIGVPDKTHLTTDLREGFTINSPEGETEIVPVVGEESTGASVSSGVATVSSNTSREVDSVIRPEYDGIQYFEGIRSSESSEAFSWKVHMSSDQELKLVNPQQAEVVFEDGSTSFLITAEQARDAAGTYVPTSLEVNGNVLTLKVEHRSGSYVYPIVAASHWETSYVVPTLVEKPEDEIEIKEREEREQREAEERAAAEAGGGEPPVVAPPSPVSPAYAERIVEANMNVGGGIAPPPEPVCHGTCATGSSVVEVFVVDELHDCQIDHCNEWNISIAHGSEDDRPKFERGFNWAEWVNHTPYSCHYYYNTALAFLGLSINEEGCQLNNTPWRVSKTDPKHLTLWGRFRISQPFGTDLYSGFKENFVALQIHIWPNGFQEPVIKHYSPAENES